MITFTRVRDDIDIWRDRLAADMSQEDWQDLGRRMEATGAMVDARCDEATDPHEMKDWDDLLAGIMDALSTIRPNGDEYPESIVTPSLRLMALEELSKARQRVFLSD